MPGPESEPLRYGMTLPNGQKLRYGMPGAKWGGTVAEVMQALENQTQTPTMLALSTTLLTTEELTAICSRISPLWTPLFAAEPLLEKIATAADANCAAIITAGTRQASSSGPLSLVCVAPEHRPGGQKSPNPPVLASCRVREHKGGAF